MQEFSVLHDVQNGFGALPGSYAIGTGDSFPDNKASGVRSRPLIFI
jgi:hypothetical protein